MKRVFALLGFVLLVGMASTAMAECDPPCEEGFECVADECVEVCTPDCVDKACGDDGCEGSCGECEEGKTCVDGQCEEAGECVGCAPWQDCVDGVCTNPEGQGDCPFGGVALGTDCHATSWEGCCGGAELYYCESAESGGCPEGMDSCLCYLDCGADDSGAVCTWNQQFFGCAQPPAQPGPNGDLMCDWFDCVGSCEGKVCGDDGCGESCGECEGNLVCEGGQCVECTPQCEGLVCGDDGCGGVCGECAGEETCVNGQCVVAGSCVGACGDSPDGSCYCDEQCVEYGDCCEDVCDACPDLSHCGGCTPDCTGKECGDDGCGNECGQCEAGETCEAGVCEAGGPCEPDCTGLECGDDGCGGSCGVCEGEMICEEGICVEETPIGGDVIDPIGGDTVDPIGGDTVAPMGDTAGEESGGGSSGSCALAGPASANAFMLLFSLLFSLPIIIRRKK